MKELLGDITVSMCYVDGTPCLALIDTGSQITTVNDSFYKEYLTSCPIKELDDILSVEGANGQEVPFLGYIEADISFSEHTNGLEEQVPTVILVVPNTNFNTDVSVLIGTNVIRYCKESCIECHGVNYLRVAEPDMAWRLAYRHLSRKNHRSKKAFVSSEVRLDSDELSTVCAMQTTILWSIINTKKLGKSFYVLVEDEKGSLPQPLQVIPTIVRVSMDGKTKRIPVTVANTFTKSGALSPRAVCSFIQQVDIVSETPGSKEQIQQLEGDLDRFKLKHPNVTLDGEQSKEALDFLLKWEPRVFSGAENGIGCTSAVKHRINLTDNTPFKQRYRRILSSQYEEVRQHLRELVAGGVIRESHSPWSSPVVLVRKKDESLRFCIDYRKLNARTVKDAYSLSRIEEALEAMGGCSWFSTLDLKSGYYQVEIEEKDREKTAFTVGPLGFYECNRIAFG